MASWMKTGLFARVCVCVCVCIYMLVKVYQINGSIVGWIKEDKNFVFTYIHGYVCVYMSDGL